MTGQIEQATKLVEAIKSTPIDRILLALHIITLIGGGWYILNIAVPQHINQLNTEMRAARIAFESESLASGKRMDRLIEIIERRMDSDDRRNAGTN